MGDREEGKKGRGFRERSNKSDSAIPAARSFDFVDWTRLSYMQLKKNEARLRVCFTSNTDKR